MKRNTNSIREDRGTFSYRLIGYIVMSIISILCLIPFWLMLSGSFSDEADIIVNGFSLWPRVYSLKAYQSIFANGGRIVRAYEVTIFVTAVGAGISILATSMTGYVLQRQDFKYRNGLSFFIYFTTLFSGGLVPWYILIINLGLKNSVWALILPTLMSPWHIMLMRNFIRSIPFEVVEAAKIDGAGTLQTIFRIFAPAAKPVIIIVAIGAFQGAWGDYMTPFMYFSPEKYPLAMALFGSVSYSMPGAPPGMVYEPLINAAAILMTIPPIIGFFFTQKHIVQGVVTTGLKG